jgi:hypothetical protein
MMYFLDCIPITKQHMIVYVCVHIYTYTLQMLCQNQHTFSVYYVIDFLLGINGPN